MVSNIFNKIFEC